MSIKIIGSSHIAKESVEEVKKQIEEWKPDIVALELDKRRLHALLTDGPKPSYLRLLFHIGVKGFLFALLASYAGKKLGQVVGLTPGSEMKEAYILAKKNKMKVALIDQDIMITLATFNKVFTWKEKWTMVKDFFHALFHREEVLRKYGSMDLTKVPEKKMIELILREAKEKYPSMYKVLIEDRNAVLASNLRNIELMNGDKRILAVMGAGHKKSVTQMLSVHKPQYTYSFSVNDQNN